MTLEELIARSASRMERGGIPSARLDAELFLCALLGCERAYLIAHGREQADADLAPRMERMVGRRLAGDPTAYLTGVQEFYGRAFRVTPAVLVPRPETELLIERALELAPRTLLDVGTGSGCIAVTCASELPDVRVTAVDLSSAALEVARDNAERYHVADRCTFLSGDLFQPLGTDARFDVIASNPPYVERTYHVETNEPELALYAGADGLDVIRELIAQAKSHLIEGGTLLCEIGESQGEAVRALAEEHFTTVRVLPDLAGHPRLLAAC